MSKADPSVLVAAAMGGLMPLLGEQLRGSAKYQALVEKAAKADAFAEDALGEIQKRYREVREDLGDLLSENGLSSVVNDFQAARPAEADPGADAPSSGAAHGQGAGDGSSAPDDPLAKLG